MAALEMVCESHEVKKNDSLDKRTLIIHKKDIKHHEDPHTLGLLTAPKTG